MLPLTAVPLAGGGEAGRFGLSDVTCRRVVLQADDGRQHLLFQEAGRTLQLAVSGLGLDRPRRLLTEAVIDHAAIPARLTALRCFNEIRTSGSLPARHFPADPRGRRLRLVLQALDGWRAGAAYRDIAVALCGEARVETDWRHPGDHLRDQVRRAVRRGRVLMEQGYRAFLN